MSGDNKKLAWFTLFASFVGSLIGGGGALSWAQFQKHSDEKEKTAQAELLAKQSEAIEKIRKQIEGLRANPGSDPELTDKIVEALTERLGNFVGSLKVLAHSTAQLEEVTSTYMVASAQYKNFLSQGADYNSQVLDALAADREKFNTLIEQTRNEQSTTRDHLAQVLIKVNEIEKAMQALVKKAGER